MSHYRECREINFEKDTADQKRAEGPFRDPVLNGLYMAFTLPRDKKSQFSISFEKRTKTIFNDPVLKGLYEALVRRRDQSPEFLISKENKPTGPKPL